MKSEDSGDCIADNFDYNLGIDYKKLVCIQYPGLVQNENKAIDTLGGIQEISVVNSSKNRRLQLHFRPDDPYSKVACSTIYSQPGILLRVKVKKKKREVKSTEIVGIVNITHKFETLADFQYLPMTAERDMPIMEKSLMNTLKPTGIPDMDWLNSHREFFLVPSVFSRVENPQKYAYHSHTKSKDLDITNNFITSYRKPRTSLIMNICFNHTDPIPMASHENAATLLTGIEQAHIDHVTKLFEERPIWSKQAIVYQTKLPVITVKNILLNIAYHYLNGPWRLLWIKFGFDPRKDPSSRIYQNIDFRLRNTGHFRDIKRQDRSRGGISVIKPQNNKTEFVCFETPSNDKTKSLNESVYIFRPGTIPPRKQIFYQYCDLKVPEIEMMLSKLGEVLPGSMCHERRGWMPTGFDEQCRDILHDIATETMKQTMENLSQSTSGVNKNYSVGENEITYLDNSEIAQSSSSDSEADDDDDEFESEDDTKQSQSK